MLHDIKMILPQIDSKIYALHNYSAYIGESCALSSLRQSTPLRKFLHEFEEYSNIYVYCLHTFNTSRPNMREILQGRS